MFKIISILLMCVFFVGCASSRFYKPMDWEKPSYESSRKDVFPSDMIRSPESYKGQLVHLVGIIEDYEVDPSFSNIVNLTIDQKYWYYIEDFSIQMEKIFLSPRGEGKVVFKWQFKQPIDEKLEQTLSESVARQDLALVYGNFTGINNGLPILEGHVARVIHEKFYSTKIFSYSIERDKEGKVVTDRGKPIRSEFKVLKIAGPGKND